MSQSNLQDLLDAAGRVMVERMNALPSPTRLKLNDAIEAGGWPEIRVGMLNQAATVRLVICNTDGHHAEICRIEVAPPLH